MSKVFRVSMTVDDGQIQGLYQMFLYSNDESRGTKKEFLDYITHQLRMNGNGEFLLPTNGMDDYPAITAINLNQLMEWGLI